MSRRTCGIPLSGFSEVVRGGGEGGQQNRRLNLCITAVRETYIVRAVRGGLGEDKGKVWTK